MARRCITRRRRRRRATRGGERKIRFSWVAPFLPFAERSSAGGRQARNRRDLVDDKNFGAAPGVIGVAAKGEQPVEQDALGLWVDRLDLRPLHQRAHLVDAADQQDVRASFAGRSHEAADRRARQRAGSGSAYGRYQPEAVALREIVLEGAHEDGEPRFMLPALIARLA